MQRGCTQGLTEPEVWSDYDPIKITFKGVKIETTCPVLTDPFRSVYLSRLTLNRHLDNGLRTLQDVDYLTYLEAMIVASEHSEVKNGSSNSH